MYLDGTTGGGVRGLYLVVKGKRSANWGLRYQLRGVTHWMGLGSALLGDGVTLDQAREKARAARAKLHDKIDPLAQRKAERAAAQVAALKQLTFSEAAKQFIERTKRLGKTPAIASNGIKRWRPTPVPSTICRSIRSTRR
jgi:hypothetical protein